MAYYFSKRYFDYVFNKVDKESIFWEMVDPYKRPKTFTSFVTSYVVAFYTGTIGAAITEQLYKEKYWEDHPGEAVPIMKPKFYFGPWDPHHKGKAPNK